MSKGKHVPRNIVKNDAGYRRGRKKRAPGRMKVYGAAYNQLSKDVSHLFSMLNVEDKYVDNANSTALAATWTSALLNGLAQGTTSSTRSGQSVKVIGVELRYTLYLAAAGTTSTTRIVLFRDKQSNATAPNLTQLFPVDVTSPRPVAYLDRFVIDVEDDIVLCPNGTSGVYRSHVFRTAFHIDFNSGNAGTIADIVTNSYYLAFVTDATVNFPVITYTARIVYVDN